MTGERDVILTKLFSRRWWLATLLVIAGVAFLIRLGFWQLDRLEQRRAFNATVASRWQQEPFDLVTEGLPGDLADLEYRRIEIDGTFDYDNQILLKERPRDGAPGMVVVTPLVLEDGRAILVARGWVPYHLSAPEHWPELEESSDKPVIGLIQESQLLPSGASPAVPDAPQDEWFLLNIDAVQPQMPYELYPVFVLQLPDADGQNTQYPIRDVPIRLDEGNHFSYAIQWFMFAGILGVGYILLIRYQEARRLRLASEGENGGTGEGPQFDAGNPDTHNHFAGGRSADKQISQAPTQQGHA